MWSGSRDLLLQMDRVMTDDYNDFLRPHEALNCMKVKKKNFGFVQR